MEIKEFEKICKKVFELAFNDFHKKRSNGQIKTTNVPRYSTQLRIAESPVHYIVELIGSRAFLPNQEIKISTRNFEKLNSTSSFFISGDAIKTEDTPLMIIGGSNCFYNLSLLPSKHIEAVKERLNLELNGPAIIVRSATIPIEITDNADGVILSNLDLLRVVESIVFFKHIRLAVIIKKHLRSSDELKTWLISEFGKSLREHHIALGIDCSMNSAEKQLAKQLISLSEQNITERIIDKFINEHKEIFANALGYQEAITQCSLKWRKRDDNDPFESIPDYVMKRNDGTFDIIDLKKGFLGKKITKGINSRTRFIDYVTELIAQLVTYERYFSSQDNRDFAEENYGLKDIEKIKLIGIVSNYNEYNYNEVNKAIAPYKDNITIISYYDLANLLIKNS